MRTLGALVCLLLLPPHALAVDWVRVETPNLIVYGPGEKRTREISGEFERYREALNQIFPVPVSTAVPTIVVAFENEAAFNPYRPTFKGKPVKVGGFYTGTSVDDMIAFPQGDRDHGLRIIFHEYTHLITSNASRGLPVWLGEGLADFYSTFEIRPDGKQALLGRPVAEHIERLNATSRWLTLPELLTVSHDSPLYNEGERRSIFYAQSWATVHLLMTGEPNRSQALSQYVQLTTGGTAPLDAWKRAFGDLDIEKELRRHLTRFSMRAFLYKFNDSVAAAKPEVKKPSAAEVDAVLSRLLRYGNDDSVEPRLLRAAAMTPASMLARALLGATYIQRGKDDEGVRLVMEAAADTSDWLTQYYVATAIVALREDPTGDRLATTLAALDRVIAARPQLAHAHALRSHLTTGAEALALVRKARALAPGREDYVFLEARAHAELRDFQSARNTLAPLLTPSYPVTIRDRARSLMGQVVRMEDAHKRSGAIPPPSGAAPPPASPTLTTTTESPSRLPAGSQWVFRELKAGEQRTEGTLEAIECSRTGGITLVVRADGTVKRFTARQFPDIDFITYREQQGGAISCGNRKPPDAVYVTWLPLEKPAPGAAGRPVAVEFLPDKK